jgi:hypothetical protein
MNLTYGRSVSCFPSGTISPLNIADPRSSGFEEWPCAL